MLANQFMLGNDQYPADLTKAYGVLVNYKRDTKKNQDKNDDKDGGYNNIASDSDDNQENNDDEEEMTFLQSSEQEKQETNKKTNSVKKKVPKQYSKSSSLENNYNQVVSSFLAAGSEPADGSSLDNVDFNYDFCFTHLDTRDVDQNLDHIFAHANFIDPDWILLDNQSTVYLFKNKDFISDIHEVTSGERLVCHSNGGSQVSTQQGVFHTFCKVWYNPQALTNI